MKLQTSILKLQGIFKPQAPNVETAAWSLEFDAFLMLEVWSLKYFRP